MVAIISGSSLRPAPSVPLARPQLKVIRGGLDAPARDYSALAAVAAVAVALLAVVGIRMVQGGPPVGGDAVAVAAIAEPGELQIVVQSGDTLWAIAESLAPGRDPRPVVDALADRNGGTILRAGDVLVVPSELVAVAPGSQLVASPSGSSELADSVQP